MVAGDLPREETLVDSSDSGVVWFGILCIADTCSLGELCAMVET